MTDYLIWTRRGMLGLPVEEWKIPKAWLHPVLPTTSYPTGAWRVSVPPGALMQSRGITFLLSVNELTEPAEPDEPLIIDRPAPRPA